MNCPQLGGQIALRGREHGRAYNYGRSFMSIGGVRSFSVALVRLDVVGKDLCLVSKRGEVFTLSAACGQGRPVGRQQLAENSF
jgi:hypothetical protein